jgi:hypothetical protein
MSINTRVGSGQLFVRFVTVGLISLFVSVVFLKFTSIFGVYTTLTLGLCIFVINLVSVLGYTFAVLKSPQILSESDAPDLAYYLGFCLTVGALSATFIVDTLLSQFATINWNDKEVAQLQTDLIKGSLIQFGVGLTATLIGLCAKIYLASKQSSESLEPEELYRNFRVEISTFEKEMRLVTDSYTKTIEDNVSRLQSSVSNACNSFDKLREVANSSNDLISKNISQDNISKPIKEFIISISSITSVTKEFISVGKESISGFKEISQSLDSMKSSVQSVDATIKLMQESTLELSNSTKGLVESNSVVKSNNQVLSTDLTGFSSNIKSASQNASNFVLTLKQVGDQITQTGQEFSELKGKANSGVENITLFSEKLGGLSNSFVQLGNQISTLQNLLIKNNSDLKSSNESNKMFISDIDDFQNVIKKITSDLVTLESALGRINKLN